MNNEHYLIHKADYISHIDDKFQLFMMLQGLANLVSKLPPNERNIPAIALAKHHRKESEEMFKTWGIPRSYMIFGGEGDLAELMENELIAPEDAGYYPIDDDCKCDFECRCGCCHGCCSDEDDEDGEPDKNEDCSELEKILSSLTHNIFGDDVTVFIFVD